MRFIIYFHQTEGVVVIFATLFRDIKFQVEAVEKIFCFSARSLTKSKKYRHINSWYFTACSSRVEKRKKSIKKEIKNQTS